MRLIKKIRDDRRGIAIELALSVMIVTFALSFLLTTVIVMQVNRKSAELSEVKMKILFEQIGEDYVYAYNSDAMDDFTADFDKIYSEDYLMELGNENKKLILKACGTEELLFCVELTEEGKIAVWKID